MNLGPRPEGTLLNSQPANAHYVNGVVVEQAAQIDRLAIAVERMESRFDKIMNLLIENKSASSSDEFKRTQIGKPFCRKCNVAGHTDQGCRARQIRTCHFCKEPGHFRQNCPELARSNVNYFCPQGTLNQSFNSVPCYPTGAVYAQSQMNQQNSQPNLGQQNPIYGAHQSIPGILNSKDPFRQQVNGSFSKNDIVLPSNTQLMAKNPVVQSKTPSNNVAVPDIDSQEPKLSKTMANSICCQYVSDPQFVKVHVGFSVKNALALVDTGAGTRAANPKFLEKIPSHVTLYSLSMTL